MTLRPETMARTASHFAALRRLMGEDTRRMTRADDGPEQEEVNA
ncbi:hypothetical protein HMPREF0321_2922 [Dermacoccus sp. Ellin185]|nr:hypothetical protein HMPREF0321_2922 [Dermacoccus sp. Ellin185]